MRWRKPTWTPLALAGESLPTVEATSEDELRPTEGVTTSQPPPTDGVTIVQTRNVNQETMAESLPSCWKTPLHSNSELMEFLERAKNHANLIKKGGLYLDPTYEEAFAKRTVSVFEVDRRTRKVCRSTKDNVMKAVKSMGYTQVVRGIGAFMWDVLLPNTEEAMKMVNSDLLTKDLILRTEYRGMRKNSVAVLEVPACVRGEALATYF